MNNCRIIKNFKRNDAFYLICLVGLVFIIYGVRQRSRKHDYIGPQEFQVVDRCPPISWSDPRYCVLQGLQPNETLVLGSSFNFSSTYLESVGIPLKHFVTINELKVNDFVFVTAANDGYFHVAMDAIGNVQRHFPNHSIFFYDLEENRAEENRNKVRNICHVTYRQFNFSRYPSHVRQLKLYSFKALIVHEMLKDFPGVFWIDTSVRFNTNNISTALDQITNNSGILTFARSHHSNYAATHGGMYRYLPISASAASNTEQRDANSIFFYRTRKIYSRIIIWWVLCALREDCMAAGRQLYCGFRGKDVWAGCHRFDQSAINILMANHFHLDDLRYLSREPVLTVQRGSAHLEFIEICSQQNKTRLKSADYFK